MIIEIARLIITIAAALLAGKLIAKLKLPAILGWLIAGMILGPHAAGLLSAHLMESGWYEVTESLLECTVGLMIGTELIWGQMKKTGKQIVVMTVIESVGTFLVVSLVFSLICIFTGLPVYLAFLFGGIALATAPAPSLSIVNEMRTSGPVTSTLIPMAAMDDLVGALVFFLVIAVVTARTSTRQIPVFVVVLLVFFPVILGAAVGFLTGKLLGRIHSPKSSVIATSAMILGSTAAGLILNWYVLPAPVLNFLLIGMAFSTVFANMIPLEQLGDIMSVLKPAVGFSLVVVILNLGAPLDYHLILGAGIYTAVYIASRAVGKYGSAFFGAAITGAPKTVRNYLGLTLLPHSGVSLIFTGIAVSTLTPVAPEYASLIQGTIAAAAVINEIIAVFMAKKGFEWAGELPDPKLRGGVHP
jgi:Kef-type K+ transport system membrane component KefB